MILLFGSIVSIHFSCFLCTTAYFTLAQMLSFRISPKLSILTLVSPFPLRRRSLPGFHQALLSYPLCFLVLRICSMVLFELLWPCCMFLLNVLMMYYIIFGAYGHSVFDTFVQLTEGRSARDIPKQPPAKKRSCFLVSAY